MAQVTSTQSEAVSASDAQNTQHSLWRRWFGQANGAEAGDEPPRSAQAPQESQQDEDEPRPGIIRRVSRKVVPGLPRAQTFRRQQAEVRNNLEPVQPTPAERRALSVDRRLHASTVGHGLSSNPRTSAPDFTSGDVFSATASAPSMAGSVYEETMIDSVGEVHPSHDGADELPQPPRAACYDDTASMTTSQYDNMIHDELERIWILNLSMHFRDKSKREKFFVTYREKEQHWRRVTISLDYRGAPDNSLEMDLLHTKFQRDKSAKIYEAIRESLVDIQFYDTVTNLKLQTTDGRLHVHVVEDVNEIIHYPASRMIQHLGCRRVRESDIEFEAHMSGFVYKVRVGDRMLIKKEIPGPDTVDEFLYEINALSRLRHSNNVIQFYGVIVDDYGECVKGLLISFAEQGALIDVIYDHDHCLSWSRRQKWARQIVEGLSEIHEAGFVQGDFTLSNIVIDHNDNAKIIDCNRRGCPVGWEPPEATPLIESNQRISMYIGVKSDLFQLGMVLWALAEQEDEPEHHGRPLTLTEGQDVPDWYARVVSICLADDPRHRKQAAELLRLFPRPTDDANTSHGVPPSISVDDGFLVQDFVVNEFEGEDGPIIKTVQAPSEWNPRNSFGYTYVDSPTGLSSDPYYYPGRGRSPPSPFMDKMEYCEPRWSYAEVPWADLRGRSYERTRPSPGLQFALDQLVPDDRDPGVAPPAQEARREKQATGKKASAIGSAIAESGKRDSLEMEVLGPLDAAGEAAEQAMNQETEDRGVWIETEQQSRFEPKATSTKNPQDADTQHIASRNKEDGVNDLPGAATRIAASSPSPFLPTKTATKNPLFQEAGTTEPEATRASALDPRAAEVQEPESTSTILDTRQAQDTKRIDSTTGMSVSPARREAALYTPELSKRRPHADSAVHMSPSLGARTSLPNNLLLHLGAGHDHPHSGQDTDAHMASTGIINDDDLAEA